MLQQIITDGFDVHKRELNKCNNTSHKLGAKILVTFKGTDDMNDVLSNEKFRSFTSKRKLSVVSFSSREDSGYSINFKKASKIETLTHMAEQGDDVDMLLFHIDMLAEGIDLPSITAVLPFRDMCNTKLIQTVGRATRLLKHDRMNFYGGVTKANEVTKMAKPHCFVLISTELFSEFEQTKRVENTLRLLATEYEVPYGELVVTEIFGGEVIDGDIPITDVDRDVNTGDTCLLSHEIINLVVSDLLTDISVSESPLELLSSIIDGGISHD